MGFAKRRRSITKVNKGQWAALILGLSVCFLVGVGGQAKAQISDLGAPQKQSVTFSFGLGSAELSERYGGNAAAMAQFDKLIKQLAGSSSARIDSIVVVSYASSANQLGNVEVAERRIDAVKAYIEPVIRQSQLRQAVVVTGNVVTRNNIMMQQEQTFDMLKRATVTIYMNGTLTADAGRTMRNRGVGEEQRYISPFGNKETDVFGRSTAGKGTTTTTTMVPSSQKTTTVAVVTTPAEGSEGNYPNIFQQREQERQVQVQQPAPQQQPQQQAEVKKKPEISEVEQQLQQQVQLLQQQVQQLQQQLQKQQQVQQVPAVQPVQTQQPTITAQPQQQPQAQQQPIVGQQQQRRYDNVVDADLQRYIDSLAATINMDELTPSQQPAAPVVVPVAPAVPAAPTAQAPKKETVSQPQAPVITAEEPCPEDRDPEIHDLIRRMVLEEAALSVGGAGNTQAQQQPQAQQHKPTTTITEVQPTPQQQQQQPAQQQQPTQPKPGRQVVAFEVVTNTGGTTTETTEEVKTTTTTKEPKPAKEPKAKPVKPVKAQHEPLELIRPLIGVKTNLAYWAAIAANLEVEVHFAKRWSAAVEGVYTNWNMNAYKKHYALNEISPEVRYWFSRRVGQYRGLYMGVYGHVGQFDYMFKDQETGNTGDYYGVGLSLGGYLPFTRHFGMELGLRGGWIHAGDFDRYNYDAARSLYIYRSSHTANYWGLTGAKVSLVYRFGLGK